MPYMPMMYLITNKLVLCYTLFTSIQKVFQCKFRELEILLASPEFHFYQHLEQQNTLLQSGSRTDSPFNHQLTMIAAMDSLG